MIKLFFLTAALLCAGSFFAGSVTIAEQGKSTYSIVIPDSSPCESIPQMAKLLAESLRRSVGATVPVVKESTFKGGPALWLGPVKKLGIVPVMAHHEARMEMRGKDLFLYGSDRKYVKTRTSAYRFYEQGSARAVMLFMRKFIKAEFPIPGEGMTGLSVPQAEKITVPGTLNEKDVPAVQYNIGRFHGVYYDLFNGHLSVPWYGEYGGHSYVKAVPFLKYGKSHPEYFALVKGKRIVDRWNHLCISNPDVQKLIKEEVIRKMDEGYEVVELSQSDGFRPCECEKCKALYNTADYGEKLWILHRRIAEEVQKVRPEKFVCIIAYGPTKMPPKSFREFPANVRIDLAPWNDETWKAWSNYRVPGGFVCYDYIFGSFNEMGFTPKRSIEFVTRHARKLHLDKITGIYRSGWGDGFGTDGPFYYIWNRLIQDPACDPQKLLSDYCQRVFGAAASEMEQYYRLISERCQKVESAVFCEPRPGEEQLSAPIKLLLQRWPLPVLTQMKELLAQAEKKFPQTPEVKFFLPVVKFDFNYLDLTVRTLEAMKRVNQNPDAKNCADLLRYSELRLACIDSLPWKEGKVQHYGNLLPFGGEKKQEIIENGRLRAKIIFPIKGRQNQLAVCGEIPCGRVMHTGGKPQQLTGLYPKDNQNPAIADYPFFMQTKWDSDALKIILTLPKGMPEKGSIFVRAFFQVGEKRLRFQGKSGWKQLHLRTRTGGVNGAKGDEFSGKAQTTAFTVKTGADNTTVVTIPWREIGLKPVKGMKIRFNLYCQYNQKVGYIWEFNPMQQNWQSAYDKSGTLILY